MCNVDKILKYVVFMTVYYGYEVSREVNSFYNTLSDDDIDSINLNKKEMEIATRFIQSKDLKTIINLREAIVEYLQDIK